MKSFNKWLEDKLNEVGLMGNQQQTTSAPNNTTANVNLNPQDKKKLADTFGKVLSNSLTKLKPGGKVDPKNMEGDVLRGIMQDPSLKNTPTNQLTAGVKNLMASLGVNK